MSLGFHVDDGLVSPETTRAVIEVIGAGHVDISTVVGDPNAAFYWQAASNPGVDPIQVMIDDTAPGTGFDTSMVALALTQAGLDSATPGAALTLGNTINGGAGNGVKVWARIDTGVVVEMNAADLRLRLTECVGVPV